MFLWLICLWLLLLGDPIQSSWLKPSFVTFKQCSLESQLGNILESFASFCASGMVPLASGGGGEGLIVLKVVLTYDDSQ